MYLIEGNSWAEEEVIVEFLGCGIPIFFVSHATFLFVNRLTPRKECECFDKCCLRWCYLEGVVCWQIQVWSPGGAEFAGREGVSTQRRFSCGGYCEGVRWPNWVPLRIRIVECVFFREPQGSTLIDCLVVDLLRGNSITRSGEEFLIKVLWRRNEGVMKVLSNDVGGL